MRRIGALLATAFVKLRLLIFPAAIAGVVWAALMLPALSGKGHNVVTSLVPKSSPALTAERISSERFLFPVISRTMVVVRNPHGLPAAREASLVALAVRLSMGRVSGYGGIAGAVPLANSLGVLPVSREHSTTVVLYLYFRPVLSSSAQTELAQRLVRRVIGHRPGEFEGVTGNIPAQAAQSQIIEERLQWVELATILLIAVAVALRFLAVGAAALTVGAVVAAYVVSERLVELLGKAGGIALPAELQPVLVVLVMGVATDYSIFFLSRYRALLAQGGERRGAAVLVVRQITPIVAAAGITVAAGTASLLVASLSFLRDFGPGLAIAVLVAMLTAIVLVPAGLALGGRRLFWPHEPPVQGHGQPESEPPPVQRPGPPVPGSRWSPARLAARHPLVATLLAVALVVAAASGLSRIAVGNELVRGLPPDAQARQAYDQASRGMVPGVLAPTLVLVSEPGIAQHRTQLARLQDLLAAQAGVAHVLGPREQPPVSRLGVAVSRDGGAARYVLFLRSDPLGPRGLSDVRALKTRLPALLRRAGLGNAHALVGGDSALSADIVDGTLANLGRITPVMLAAIFLVLAVYLRALVAPAYLVLTSLLAVLSALGLTVYVMQELLGYREIAYYVIFTVAVLLVSLGSDYNVFLIGRIWQHARRRPVREAVEEGGVRAARPIALAGLVLAGAFALLAIVPLNAFREIAFAMATGLLIDAFIVRAILVPAIVVIVGPRSAWPRRWRGEQNSSPERGQLAGGWRRSVREGR